MRKKDDSVTIVGIRPELLFGISVVDFLLHAWFRDRIVITSGSEKTTKHSYKSLHYSGCAVDFRIPVAPDSTIEKFVDEAKTSLGSEFDLVWEDDHFHLEFQPKVYYL